MHAENYRNDECACADSRIRLRRSPFTDNNEVEFYWTHKFRELVEYASNLSLAKLVEYASNLSLAKLVEYASNLSLAKLVEYASNLSLAKCYIFST